MISALLKEQLRLRGNPYAKLSLLDDAELRREYLVAMQNPYASLGVEDFPGQANSHNNGPFEPLPPRVFAQSEQAAAEAEVRGVSKKEFETRCRAVFEQYIPLAERGGGLRTEYRKFMANNGSKSALSRAKVLRELERYDLSALGTVKLMLNREREEYLIWKLRAISKAGDE